MRLRDRGAKRLNHAVVGEIEVSFDSMQMAAGRALTMGVLAGAGS